MSRHHSLLLILLPLAACSMISGSKVPSSSGGGNVADKYDKATELPVSLQNMKKLGERIDVELAKLDKGLNSGEITSTKDLGFVRTNLISYYGYGQKGGSEDCAPCKNHPAFPGLKDNYTGLDQRLRALEVKYNKCNYGYQMSNGDILKPTFEWSPEEWASIRTKSKHQTPRCWLIDDPEHYYRS
ncbi:MAG TPA: hypothetical protein VLM79_30080 [Kofleriaceae bacterium]|nr:hypothetical protein [Kofleriaceae bacterium]